MKSPRNKTIDFSVDTHVQYLESLIEVTAPKTLSDIQNQIICGDTFKVLPFLPLNTFDLVIVDPPYNLRKNYHGNVFTKQHQDDYLTFTRQWIEAVMPLIKDNGSMYVCCDWESSLLIGPLLSEYFMIQNRITWQREKGRGAKHNWKNGLEDIWFVTKSKTYTFNVDKVKVRKKVLAPYTENGLPKDFEVTVGGNFRNTHPSNFWDDVTIPYWSIKENTAHPTQKPEKLIAKLLLASSHENDVILDPFAGSGTTLVTANKLNRHFVGIEQNPQYCVWAKHRLDMAKEDKSIQGYSDGVFWERNTRHEQNKK